MNIEYLINNLDQIMIYFIPATVFMVAYRLTARYSAPRELFSANTVIWSYVLTVGLRWFWPNISIPIIIAVSFALGFFGGIVRNSGFVAFLLDKVFYKSLDEDVWYAISDFKKGTTLRVYLDDSDISYQGYFTEDHKSEDGHRWIVLTNYKKFVGNESHTDEPLFDYKEDNTRKIVLDTTKISRAEIKYPRNSCKI